MNRLHDGQFGDASHVLLRVPRCDAPAPKAAPRAFVESAPPPRSLAWDFLPKLALAGLVVGLVAVAGVVFQNPDAEEPAASESTPASESQTQMASLDPAETAETMIEWPGTLAPEPAGAVVVNASLSDEVPNKNSPSRLTVESPDARFFARQTTTQSSPSLQAPEQPSPAAEEVTAAPRSLPQINRGPGQDAQGRVQNYFVQDRPIADERPPIEVAKALRQPLATPVNQAHLGRNIEPVPPATEYHVPYPTRR